MITASTTQPSWTLFGSAKEGINKSFNYLANIVSSVARFFGREITPKQDMTQPTQTSLLRKVQSVTSADALMFRTSPLASPHLNLRTTTKPLNRATSDLSTSDLSEASATKKPTAKNASGEAPANMPKVTTENADKIAAHQPLITNAASEQRSNDEPELIVENNVDENQPVSSTDNLESNPEPLTVTTAPKEDRAEILTQKPNEKPNDTPNDDSKSQAAETQDQPPHINDTTLSKTTLTNTNMAQGSNTPSPAIRPNNIKREKIVLCEHDAGKSPHFITSPKTVLNNFVSRLAKEYQLDLPAIAQDNKEATPIEKTFEKLIDNLCEPWAHNDTMKSWDLHHITETPLDPVEAAMLEIDAQDASPEMANKPKAGDGIFTTNKKTYIAIVKVLANQLNSLATDRGDTIDKIKSDMADPNFWRDLVIKAPKVGKATAPDRIMFDKLANTFKQYYSHGTIGEGLEDIKKQVENNKPFLATVHHTANTTEITPFHQAMDDLVKSHQPKNTPYNTNRAVRTLAHSTFHQHQFFQKIMDGSGTLTATQNVSRSMLNNKEAQGIICATGGTPEAKRTAEQRHTTHWQTIKGEQRNGLATLSIDTQTPVTVVTCVNADELFDVKANEETEKKYKTSRTSAIDAVSRLGNKFYMQLGNPGLTRIMFSAPLPLKSHASSLISPPAALKPEDFASYDEFETANQSLATAFSHHLESHQQEQIFFDLAFTHRDDLGSRRKTQYLIYKMLDALIKSDNDNDKTGHQIIDGPVAGLKEEYKKFQAQQKAAGLPDSHNNAFSAEIMREVFKLADAYKYPTEFFSSKLCQAAYMETLPRIERFEKHLSFEERETQKAWFDTFNSMAISAFLKRNYQYFGAGLSNNLYLMRQLVSGVTKKAIFGSDI